MSVSFSLEIRHPGEAGIVAYRTGAARTRVHQTTPDPRAEDSRRLWQSYHPVAEAAEAPSPPIPAHHQYTVVEPASLSPFLCNLEREPCEPCPVSRWQGPSLPRTSPISLAELGTCLPVKRSMKPHEKEADSDP